jgi:hypothetical protein
MPITDSDLVDAAPMALEPDCPFAWSAVFDAARDFALSLATGPHAAMKIALFEHDGTDVAGAAERALQLFSVVGRTVSPGSLIDPAEEALILDLGGDTDEDGRRRFVVRVARPGPYALFTQHGRDQFDLRIEHGSGGRLTPIVARFHRAEHARGGAVSHAVGSEGAVEARERQLTTGS